MQIVLYSTILSRTRYAITEQTHGGFTISQIHQLQGRIFEKLLKAYAIDDFNGPQGRILFVLWQEDNLPIRDLSQKTSLAKTSLTSMLDRMENKGYLKRMLDTSDRRLIRIVLTEKAKAMRDRYQQVSNLMSEILYKGFFIEERRHIDDLLFSLPFIPFKLRHCSLRPSWPKGGLKV